MKRKYMMACLLAGSIGFSAFAADDMAFWDFSGTDGTSISNAVDSINGWTFPDHYGAFLSNDTLWVTGGTNATGVGPTFDAPVSTRIRATWEVPMANLTDGSTVGVAFHDVNGTAVGNLRLGAGADGKLRLSSYTRKSDDSEMQWVYVTWLGGVSELKGPINLSLEYDPATGTNYLSWSGSFNGSKEIAALPSSVASLGLDINNGSLTNTDYEAIDNLLVQKLGAPTGVYIKKAETAFIEKTNATIRVGSFAVTNGDYIAVMLASSAGGDPVESSVTFSGDGGLGTVLYTTANSGQGATAFTWYAPVTSAGTVNLDCAMLDLNATFVVGAYQLRSATGGVVLLGTAEDSVQEGSTQLSGIYTFSGVSTGLVLEAISTYQNTTPQNPNTIVDENQWNQRISAHAEFEGIGTLTNVWVFGGGSQGDLVGVAFGAVPSGVSPGRQRYDTWAASYQGFTDTAMTNNPDGDLLDNLAEYAFGGDPTDAADQGIAPVTLIVSEGGTNYMQYIYARYSDYAVRSLVYSLQVNDDLIYRDWLDTGYTVEGVGVGAFGDGFDAVTNQIPIDLPEKFIRSKVEFLQ